MTVLQWITVSLEYIYICAEYVCVKNKSQYIYIRLLHFLTLKESTGNSQPLWGWKIQSAAFFSREKCRVSVLISNWWIVPGFLHALKRTNTLMFSITAVIAVICTLMQCVWGV